MTKKKEQVPQNEAKNFEAVDPEQCGHSGYFVGFGFEAFPLPPSGVLCVSAVICMRCSKQWFNNTVLNIPIAIQNQPNSKGKIIS